MAASLSTATGSMLRVGALGGVSDVGGGDHIAHALNPSTKLAAKKRRQHNRRRQT